MFFVILFYKRQRATTGTWEGVSTWHREKALHGLASCVPEVVASWPFETAPLSDPPKLGAEVPQAHRSQNSQIVGWFSQFLGDLKHVWFILKTEYERKNRRQVAHPDAYPCLIVQVESLLVSAQISAQKQHVGPKDPVKIYVDRTCIYIY